MPTHQSILYTKPIQTSTHEIAKEAEYGRENIVSAWSVMWFIILQFKNIDINTFDLIRRYKSIKMHEHVFDTNK